MPWKTANELTLARRNPGWSPSPRLQSALGGLVGAAGARKKRRAQALSKPVAMEDRIAALWAIESIKVLKSRYFQAVDEKEYDTITSLFTPAAVIDFSGEPQHHVGHHGVRAGDIDSASWRVIGGAEAGRVIATAVQDIVTVHQGHDPQIVMTGPRSANGRWTLYDRLEFPDETMHGFGHYLEEYEFSDGQWRISKLLLTRIKVTWAANRTQV